MKLKILSDLHIGIDNLQNTSALREDDEDLIIAAGDIDERCPIEWLRYKFPTKPIIFVPGNHEYYSGLAMATQDQGFEDTAALLGVHALNNKSVTIDGVKFIGTTLWTNFGLYGEHNREKCMQLAEKWIVDFVRIRLDPVTRFTTESARALYERSAGFLIDELIKSDPTKTVVVTHFAPHERSVAPRFKNDYLTPYFVNNMGALMGKMKLWVHGHTHTSFDYEVGDSSGHPLLPKTRVVANPSGYRGETKTFNPNLIVEI